MGYTNINKLDKEYRIVFIDFLRRDSIYSRANVNEDPFMK